MTVSITRDEATGTIRNTDPLPQAPMARFGRTAAVHVVEHIEERMVDCSHRGLQELVHLGLSDNRIADVGLLAELRSLQRLDLTGNRVSDMSPLGDLSGLVWLRLPGNPVSDVAPLGRLTRLRWLWLDVGAVDVGTLVPLAERAGAPLWIERQAAVRENAPIPRN